MRQPGSLVREVGRANYKHGWVGNKPNKGLGILAFGDYSVELLTEYDERLEWIAPVTVTGPCSFLLLAA